MNKKLLCLKDYEEEIANTRDKRMEWWRQARFGMFVHYGTYSLLGRNEWALAMENIPPEEYDPLADRFQPRKGCPREWARLASEAGMKYMVLTTKHHEGFCLWGTRQTDYNSVKRGPKRDIVAEYVEACREFNLKIGFYYSLMDWHHPDGGSCAYDPAARRRFLDFTQGCVNELLSNYGRIDLLWYDVPLPFKSAEGWESLQMNQMARELQPQIIINNRSRLPEDFGTPEGHVTAEERDWEACMTFNGSSWGYVPSEQVVPDSYNVRGILRMLNMACSGAGNLLLNIGPAPDGSVPEEAVEPLRQTGRWLEKYGEAVYGGMDRASYRASGCGHWSRKGNRAFFWCRIWPGRETGVGGFMTPLKAVRLLPDGMPVKFEQQGQRIVLKDLPESSPDPIAGMPVIEFEFEEEPRYVKGSLQTALHGGKDYSGEF
ncbi:MAG: alpha-L-fucosidase [Verrucomicrobiota bacterium]